MLLSASDTVTPRSWCISKPGLLAHQLLGMPARLWLVETLAEALISRRSTNYNASVD